MMTKKLNIVFLSFLLLIFSTLSAYSQCSVCRAGAESSVEQGYTVGKGLNKGIIYLMSVPYVLAGAALYIYYKNKKNKKSA
jgi:prolipoprotein diacylglyceryltransferase